MDTIKIIRILELTITQETCAAANDAIEKVLAKIERDGIDMDGYHWDFHEQGSRFNLGPDPGAGAIVQVSREWSTEKEVQ